MLTEDQIESINAYQRAGVFHPFTCGVDSNHAVLKARSDGLFCPDCSYSQTRGVPQAMKDWSWVPADDYRIFWDQAEPEFAQLLRARRDARESK
jgi:hypothetical protein